MNSPSKWSLKAKILSIAGAVGVITSATLGVLEMVSKVDDRYAHASEFNDSQKQQSITNMQMQKTMLEMQATSVETRIRMEDDPQDKEELQRRLYKIDQSIQTYEQQILDMQK